MEKSGHQSLHNDSVSGLIVGSFTENEESSITRVTLSFIRSVHQQPCAANLSYDLASELFLFFLFYEGTGGV
jgi:hypothetical protein